MSKPVKFIAVIALATIATVLPGSAENLRTGIMPAEKEPLFRVPKDAKDAVDSAEFLELSAVIYTLDSNYWDYIRGASTMDRFVSRIADHQQKHATEWLLALRGLEWAKDSAHCLGNPWQFEVDDRWAYFIRFGPPSAYWSPMYEVTVPGGRIDTTQTFFNWWSALDTGFASQVFKAEWYPPESSLMFPRVKTIVGDTIRSKFGKNLYPEMDIVSFPNEDNTFDVAIVSSVTGDRFTKETILDRRKLEVELRVFSDDTLVFVSHQTQKLGLTGLILSVTANDEDLTFLQHFTVPSLSKGKYKARLTIDGHRNNTGKANGKFVLPSIFRDQEGMSDLFLLDRYPVAGDDVSGGIQRQARNLKGRGSHDFIVGDTLSLYIEVAMPNKPRPDSSDVIEWSYLDESGSEEYFTAPADTSDWFTFKVFLEPDEKKAPDHGSNLRFVVTHDSLNNPLLTWNSVDTRKALSELARENQKENRSFHFLAARVIRAREGANTSFESSFEVGKVKPGKYWLVIVAEGLDSSGRKLFRNSSRTRVEINFPPPTISSGL